MPLYMGLPNLSEQIMPIMIGDVEIRGPILAAGMFKDPKNIPREHTNGILVQSLSVVSQGILKMVIQGNVFGYIPISRQL